ncbi:MAG: DUF1559 domain-containing protein, partial [Planctomycetota bacterium]
IAPQRGWSFARNMLPTECQPLVDVERPAFWAGATATVGPVDGRGFRWAEFRPNFSGFFTILPPNREICTEQNAGNSGFYTASSRHQGGVHVLMADGAVIFLTDSIDAGSYAADNLAVAGGRNAYRGVGEASPYGLWGALGTRGNKETIEESLNQ